MPRDTDPSRSHVVLGGARAQALVVALVLMVAGCSQEGAGPAATPGSFSALAEAGRIEMAGSGFAVTVPDDWVVEVADPDPDVLDAEPGAAWWALKASAPHALMACSVAVGVTDLPPNRWGVVIPSSGTEPHWGPSRPWQFRVPTPDVPQAELLQSQWLLPPGGDENLRHDVFYSLDCAANRVRVPLFGEIFRQIRGSFRFLPQ